jgi:AcrR family transcriptional regulator
MVYDSAATRARLLDAAYAEFSERGLAGARVDRIAAAASANKQAIYAYFGSKDGLFDAMLAARLGVLSDAVPFTPDDLPAYAGALFDAMVESPELVRLTQWKSLESSDASEGEAEAYRLKAVALQAATGIDQETAIDLLIMIIAMATAWTSTGPALQALGSRRSATARRRAHRAAVVAGVEAIAATLPSRSAAGA